MKLYCIELLNFKHFKYNEESRKIGATCKTYLQITLQLSKVI